MKRSQAIIFAILAFAFTIAQSQQSQRTNEMQELVIRGFQGGLITAVGDENMPDNALGAVENYVFTKNKYLYGPRWAFQLWNTTDTSSNDSDLIEALFAYYDDDTSKILAVMRNSADTLIKGTNQIVVLNKTNGTISEELFKFAYRRGLRANTDGIHWGRIHEDSVLYISNAKGQLMVYDGFKLYFAKPPGPGQPQAVTAGPGNLTGRYKYRYTYHQHDDTGVSPDTGHLDWETLFSIQSEPVYPFGERVYIYDLLPPRDTTKYNIILYRTKADGEVFYALDTIGDSTRVYTDNTADGSLGDTANYYYGGGYATLGLGLSGTHYKSTGRTVLFPGGFKASNDTLFPPGAPEGHMINASETPPVFGRTLPEKHVDNAYIAYSIVYVDSNGVYSRPSPPTYIPADGLESTDDSGHYVELWDIQVPAFENYNVKYKLLLRRHKGERTNGAKTIMNGLRGADDAWVYSEQDSIVFDSIDYMFILDSLVVDSSYPASVSDSGYIDTVRPRRMIRDEPNDTIRNRPIYRGYVSKIWPDTFTSAGPDSAVSYDDHPFLNAPESISVNDSSVIFQPGTIALYRGRMFASGDLLDRNDIFYSQTGNFLKFPASHIMEFPTGDGDVNEFIQSVEDGLLLLKQKNLQTLRGSRFIDFRQDRVFDDKGLVGKNAAGFTDRKFNFVDRDAIYQFNLRNGQLLDIGKVIEDQIDSLGINRLKLASLAIVNGDIWISIPTASGDTIVNDKIFVFDTDVGAWLAFTGIGFQSIVNYDLDRTRMTWFQDRYIVGSNRNKLYKYGYDKTDSLDNVSDTIVTYMRTKFFFDGQPGHKFIYYLDVIGEGKMDRCIIQLLRDKTVNGFDTAKAVDTVLDFTAKSKHRIFFGSPVTSAAIAIRSFQGVHHIIKGFNIGWKPWDDQSDYQ